MLVSTPSCLRERPDQREDLRRGIVRSRRSFLRHTGMRTQGYSRLLPRRGASCAAACPRRTRASEHPGPAREKNDLLPRIDRIVEALHRPMLCRDLRGFRGLARLELSRLKVADQLTDLHDAGSIVGIDHDGIADPIKPDRAPATTFATGRNTTKGCAAEPRGLETLGGVAPPELLRSKRRTVEKATSRVRLPNNLYSLFVSTERVGPLALGERSAPSTKCLRPSCLACKPCETGHPSRRPLGEISLRSACGGQAR